MVTKTLEVPLPANVKERLQTPICIPMPKPGKAQITLPFGGATIQAFNDITKGIPDDCSLNFSLMLQVAPLLANMKCLIEALKVVEPLVTLITALGKADLPAIAQALPKFLDAVPPLVDCIAKFFVGVPLFLRDLLMMLAKLLGCVVQTLRSALAVMSGLQLQIASARADNNTALLAALECAHGQAQASAQHALTAVDPLLVILSLCEPLFGLADVSPIQTPQIGSDESIEGLTAVIDVLDTLAKTLRTVAEGLVAQ
ncbi:hypothetical protein [Sphaerotilus microaerophilus]|uniref:Uncharacterized protein n=1 Tax=Sphaerotilus microaerophilus TaxID=2914710 RepID=A0ABM7YN95_9BURK|nr:hypothetical protein [Sphaerotilus sp. FB-5]BDI05909.1 hypothetical protein CATMQ487_28790 [Sphaerotilus sp. FB-5]